MCSPIERAFVPEQVLGGGTFTVSWFVDQFQPCGNLKLPLSAEELLEVAASKLPPGALGLMLVPYWNAVMPPYWDPAATGITIGWTGVHRREHLSPQFWKVLLTSIGWRWKVLPRPLINRWMNIFSWGAVPEARYGAKLLQT